MELLRLKKLTESEKKYVYELVKGMRKGTDLQKRRFYMYYSLGPNAQETNTMPKIAKFYECTASAIRGSIKTVQRILLGISDDEMLKLKNIVASKINYDKDN